MIDFQKCAIIGCGFVGSATAFSLVESGLFSEMVLLDANPDKAEGEAMDLSHGLPFAQPMRIYAGTYDDIADCGLVVITAGANQKPGETRLQLVKKNVSILKSIIPQIKQRGYEGILLVVSNPVDILTYAAWKLSGFPAKRVIGSGTVLDTARLKYLLGEHLGVDSRSVHAFIIGEHGDSELAVWSSANISGVDLADFCELKGESSYREDLHSLYENVRDSAYQIIEKKGATYYAIALAVSRIVEAILRDERSILTVSSLFHGEYGVEDVCLSAPTVVDRSGASHVLEVKLNQQEKRALQQSAETLKQLARQIGF